jgi:hypothetical protein
MTIRVPQSDFDNLIERKIGMNNKNRICPVENARGLDNT